MRASIDAFSKIVRPCTFASGVPAKRELMWATCSRARKDDMIAHLRTQHKARPSDSTMKLDPLLAESNAPDNVPVIDVRRAEFHVALHRAEEIRQLRMKRMQTRHKELRRQEMSGLLSAPTSSSSIHPAGGVPPRSPIPVVQGLSQPLLQTTVPATQPQYLAAPSMLSDSPLAINGSLPPAPSGSSSTHPSFSAPYRVPEQFRHGPSYLDSNTPTFTPASFPFQLDDLTAEYLDVNQIYFNAYQNQLHQ